MFADMAELHAKWLPERPGFEVHREREKDLHHRAEILQALAKEGVRFSRKAKQPVESKHPKSAVGAKAGWAMVAAGLAMFCFGGLLTIRAWYGPLPLAPTVSFGSVPAPPVTDLARVRSESALQAQIEIANATQQRLEQQLAAEKLQAVSLHKSNAESVAQVDQLKQQLEVARATQQRAENQLADLRSKQSTADTIAMLQQAEIEKLNRRLSDQTTTMDRDRQLAALGGHELRDLIAARNLHIIDVYDTNSQGKTNAAFGRIFYTEGKSLIFYAYDLSGKQVEDGKGTLVVWGKRDGAPQDVKNLGALAKDDHVQKRWVFTTSDTKILASIDSVFVTIESTPKPGSKPNGRPLLNAYLGTAANHP